MDIEELKGRVPLVDPQSSRDRGSNEEEDDEDIVKLGEELSPRRSRRVCRQFVPTVLLESHPRFVVAQSLAGIRA
jgi:hypothetical protein